MAIMTATEFQKGYEKATSLALSQPVTITKHGSPRLLLVNYALVEQMPPHIQALITREPVAGRVEDLDDAFFTRLRAREVADET